MVHGEPMVGLTTCNIHLPCNEPFLLKFCLVCLVRAQLYSYQDNQLDLLHLNCHFLCPKKERK
jgi:hypothetical protein